MNGMEFNIDVFCMCVILTCVCVCVCGYICVWFCKETIQQRYLAIILVGISQYKASHNLTLILAIFSHYKSDTTSYITHVVYHILAAKQHR